MAECTHDCSTCSANCGERTQPQDIHAPANAAGDPAPARKCVVKVKL